MKTFLMALLVGGLVTPAVAADEFYIVQDVATKKCAVVDKKPTSTTVVGVGNVYKTRAEAENAMKGAKNCASK